MPSPEQKTNGNENSTQDEQPVVRELTQTDRLNNKLLKSFLQHISGFEGSDNTKNPNDSDDEDRSAEFED